MNNYFLRNVFGITVQALDFELVVCQYMCVCVLAWMWWRCIGLDLQMLKNFL